MPPCSSMHSRLCSAALSVTWAFAAAAARSASSRR